MLISLIAAMQPDRGIGWRGGVPWHLSDDLRHFKRVTMGHHLVQGRVTWESIGRPLAGRRMLVVTRQETYRVPAGVEVVHSLEAGLELARQRGEDELFIGGGADLYAAALPLADRIYLTEVEASAPVDTRFPEFDRSAWRTLESWTHPADDRNDFPFTFSLLARSA
jgi:dihydrofolate reductase